MKATIIVRSCYLFAGGAVLGALVVTPSVASPSAAQAAAQRPPRAGSVGSRRRFGLTSTEI